MVRFTGGLLLFSAFRFGTAAPSSSSRSQPAGQHVLNVAGESPTQQRPRKLQGRFLHITDIHPDPFYKTATDPDGEHPCHAGKGRAGYYGAEKTDCDSPFSLVNATFDWIQQHLADKIDFVVWTGDSARHDNDVKIPRTNKGVEDLNQLIVDKFVQVFARQDDSGHPGSKFEIPIVPTLGNNDILPHNIFPRGPNKWTRKYLDIWNDFIPPEQAHTFARGGWFYTEVIPNKLAVFSLNTLYFFDSNAAVDGCDAPDTPGYEHFEWLRIQLKFLRQRRMKAILIGHVPPARTKNKQNWDESCYQKYTLWQRQYRDVIVANLFGHMNIDHFMLQDVKDLKYKWKIDGIDNEHLGGKSRAENEHHGAINETLGIQAKSDYLVDLRKIWSKLPSPPKGFDYDFPDSLPDVDNSLLKNKQKKKWKKFLKKIGGRYGERFSLSLVSPSVVPNFYPTLRVIEYNISGLEHDHPPAATGEHALLLPDDTFGHDKRVGDIEEQKKKKNKKKPSFPVPRPPHKSAKPGPAYLPQTFSLLSFTQHYANITKVNAKIVSEVALLQHQVDSSTVNVSDIALNELAKKHFGFEVEYSTNDDKQYRMRDLTVRRWLELAERMGREKFKIDTHTDSWDDEEDWTLDDEENDIEDSDEDYHERTNNDVPQAQTKKKGSYAIKHNHLWRTFIKRAFVHAKLDEELDDEFR